MGREGSEGRKGRKWIRDLEGAEEQVGGCSPRRGSCRRKSVRICNCGEVESLGDDKLWDCSQMAIEEMSL